MCDALECLLDLTTNNLLCLASPSLFHLELSQAVKAAVAGAAVTAGVAVSPAFAGDVGAGEQVFNANCAACHAGHGSGPRLGQP